MASTSLDVLDVYYDGACTFCRDVVRLLAAIDWRGRLRFTPYQHLVLEPHDPLRGADLQASLHVRDDAGALAHGAGAFLWIARRVPLLWPLALVGRLPFVKRMLEPAYGLVARNRHRLGCRDDAACARWPS